MRIRILAAACILSLICGAAAVAAQPPANIAKPIQTVIHATNTGKTAALAHLYTSDAVVVDEDAPFIWTGAGAGVAWLGAVGKAFQQMKMTGFKAAAGPASEYQHAGRNAYAIVPLTLTGTAGKKAFRETGTFTFTLRQFGGIWKISSQVWTTRSSSM